MNYLDFDLSIERESGREYRLFVHSPAGETYAQMHFPLDEVALDLYLTKLAI